jgi:hypothetical protein
MSSIIEFKKLRYLDLINGNDSDALETIALKAMKAFDDGKLIENLQTEANHDIYDALFTCVNSTFQRARAFNELKQAQTTTRH